MLFKDIGSELADVDLKQGIVVHDWSALGNLDAHDDLIVSGAYAKTIQERGPQGSGRIKFLWQHDPWEPIGKPTELYETEDTLRAVTKIAGTQRGKDALVLYEAGVLTEHSVGIDILRRDEEDRRRILEVRLWEGSVVTWGANPLTPLIDVKSDHPASAWKRVTEHMAKMRRALRSGLSDSTAEQLELALGTLEAHLTDIQQQLATAPADERSAPPQGTRADSAPQDGLKWLNDQLDTFNQHLIKP